MHPYILIIEAYLLKLPLPGFVLIGSFLEEVVAPIPASFIMVTAGLSGQQQRYTLLGFAVLLTLASIGKTLASIVLYVIGDKAENVVVGKYGKYFDLDHEKVLRFGALLSKGWWDDAVLLFLRAVPIFPTFFVSIVCGALRVNKKTFVVTTLLGSMFRNAGYLLLGIYGITSARNARTLVEENPVLFAVLLLAIALSAAATYWLYAVVQQKMLAYKEKRQVKENGTTEISKVKTNSKTLTSAKHQSK